MSGSNVKVSFHEYLRAGYPVIWVRTYEEDRAMKDLSAEAGDYTMAHWDIVGGYKGIISNNKTDPLFAITAARDFNAEHAIFFLKDFHKFIKPIEVMRALKNSLSDLKNSDKHIVIISPVVDIPIEVQKDVVVYDFKLPTEKELVDLAEKLVKDNSLKNVKVDPYAVASAKGLTILEAENAFALSIAKTKTFDKGIIEHEKLQNVRKSGLLEIYESIDETQIGGLINLRNYTHNRKRGFIDKKLPQPKGIILVGLPGAGKSLSAKVIASILDYPLVRLDIASLKGSLVGESEQKTRQALAVIDAISPCVVWLDEIEKALGGVQSSNKTDGGTSSAMFGYLLTWMQESTEPKYIVATCNDIDDLLSISQGALLRRFDDVFFMDMPSLAERKEILTIMNKRYGTEIDIDLTEKMEGWTGAEIEKFVKASVYDGVDHSLESTKPIYHQNKDKIEKAREWAERNARIANEEVFEAGKGNGKAKKRGIKVEDTGSSFNEATN